MTYPPLTGSISLTLTAGDQRLAFTVACRGLVVPGTAARLYVPLPSSSIEECEKCKHLKYVKIVLAKQQVSKYQSKNLSDFFALYVSVFHNFFYSVQGCGVGDKISNSNSDFLNFPTPDSDSLT